MSLAQVIFPVAVAVGGGLSFTLLAQVSVQETVAQVQQNRQTSIAEQAAEAKARDAEQAAQAQARAAERAAEQAAKAEAEAIALVGDPEKGKMMFGVCVACHGRNAEGQRMFNAPRLANQTPWYLKRQLEKFKEGVRGTHPLDAGGMQMAPMAKLLRDETTVDDVVAYVMTLKPPKPADRGKGDVAAGKEAYAVCVACHGPKAQGIESQKAPKLTGQHAWYVSKQIKNFKGGVRGAHADDVEGKLMGPISQLLADDKAIDDVVAYIQSLDQE